MLTTFLSCIELPEALADRSLTSLQLKLIKNGARVVRHTRVITFQLAEVVVTGPMVMAIPPRCVAFEHHRHARDSDLNPNWAKAAGQVCPPR
jgi:hypothetical protein